MGEYYGQLYGPIGLKLSSRWDVNFGQDHLNSVDWIAYGWKNAVFHKKHNELAIIWIHIKD